MYQSANSIIFRLLVFREFLKKFKDVTFNAIDLHKNTLGNTSIQNQSHVFQLISTNLSTKETFSNFNTEKKLKNSLV